MEDKNDLQTDTRIPPAAHPGTVDANRFPSAHRALRSAYTRLSKVHDAIAEVRADTTLTADAQALEIEELREKGRKIAERGRGEAGEAVTAAGTRARAKVRELESGASTAHAQEIRQHFKALGAEGRRKALETAASEGNAAVLGAVASAPRMLSGFDDLTEPQFQSLIDAQRRRLAPDEFAQIDAGEKAWQGLLRGYDALVESLAGSSKEKAQVMKAHQRREARKRARAEIG